MIVLVLFIQIISLVFFFKILAESESYTDKESNTLEGYLWYFIAGLNFIFILRFIYVQINFSYVWYDQVMEFISLGISLFIVIPTSIYYFIKRNRKNKKKKL